MGPVEIAILLFAALAIGGTLYWLCRMIARAERETAKIDEDSEFHASMARWGYLHDRREGGA